MEVIVVKDYQELSKVAAEIIIEEVKKNPNAILGLATGGTPLGTYENIINAYKQGEVSFKGVKTFNLDEYCGIDKKHPQSYYHYMHENLFNHIDVLPENINIPSTEGNDLQAQCDKYNELLNQNTIDLQLLGIGGNGHIGFNEPGTPFTQETFVVELAEKTREDNKRFFNSIDEVPTHAITMGIKNIISSKKILMLISGKSKVDAAYNLIKGPVTEDFPASVLNNHPNTIVIIDEEAYSKLK
jgi:glucosamine-6-phosphate deaminase